MHTDTCSVIKQRLIHISLFLLLAMTGGNAFGNGHPAETLTAENLWDVVVVECIERFFAPMPAPLPGPPPPDPYQIVVGCRLTNCGLQSQVHSPIELRISVKSDLVTSTVLDIENMLAADAGGIEILQGEVDRRDPLQWTIGSGVTRLRGFSVPREMRPPVVTIRPLPNETRVLALTQRFREMRNLRSQDIAKIEIDIEQWRDNSLISRKRILVKLRFCDEEPKDPQDRITLQKHPGTPSPTVLLNGRRNSGCIDSTRRAAVETHTGDSTIFLGNMLSNGGCHSEASIFLKDRAMRLKEIDLKTPTWTNDPIDIVPVDVQQPPIQVPVNLWILWPDDNGTNKQQGMELTKNKAIDNLREANSLYGNTQSGIQFFMPDGSAVVIDESMSAGLELESATCNDVRSLASVGYVTNQLNVYYVGDPPWTTDDSATGWHCVTDDVNVIIIRAAIEKRATLAHELGHALSLQNHANALVSQTDENGSQVFSATNIMWSIPTSSTVDNRFEITKGQSFRGNVSEGSALYRMIFPSPGGGHLDTAVPSPGRNNCTEGHTSAWCPWIGAN